MMLQKEKGEQIIFIGFQIKREFKASKEQFEREEINKKIERSNAKP